MTILDETSFPGACSTLAGRDPRLRAVVDAWGVPEFWHRPPGFASLVLFIVEQQVSLASAKAVFDRMRAALTEVTPGRVLEAHPDTLRECGLTRQKLSYVVGLAQLVEEGRIDLGRLETLDDPEARSTLLTVSGIGPWTADVYLLSCLRRPDVWPVGDRALQVGTGELLGMAAPPTPDELVNIGERWRPLRSVAARLIWNDYLARRNRSETDVAGLGT